MCGVPQGAVVGPPGLTSGSGVSQLSGRTTISRGPPSARVTDGTWGAWGAWGARRSGPTNGSWLQWLPQVSGQLCNLFFGNKGAQSPEEGHPEHTVRSMGTRCRLSEGGLLTENGFSGSGTQDKCRPFCVRPGVSHSLGQRLGLSELLKSVLILARNVHLARQSRRGTILCPCILFSGHLGLPHVPGMTWPGAWALRRRSCAPMIVGHRWGLGREHLPLIMPPHSSLMRCSLASFP